LSAKFLQQVLQLSNYSQLGSAPLLDPLVASKDYQQMQEVVQQQQTLFCRWVSYVIGMSNISTSTCRQSPHRHSAGMTAGLFGKPAACYRCTGLPPAIGLFMHV
jgi:hypothetical protein